jgi:hypothetical protein
MTASENIRLLTVSKDRHIAEYDLNASNPRIGVVLLVILFNIDNRISGELSRFIVLLQHFYLIDRMMYIPKNLLSLLIPDSN